MLGTYSDSMNSHIPSDARIIAISLLWKCILSISGSLITPIDEHRKSPILLVIASPGIFSFLSQTLRGSVYPLEGQTLPPDYSILVRSSTFSGF